MATRQQSASGDAKDNAGADADDNKAKPRRQDPQGAGDSQRLPQDDAPPGEGTERSESNPE